MLQRGNGIGVGAQVAQRIRFGPSGFAKHVIGVEIALLREGLAALYGLVDRAAKHELFAHFAHRGRHCRADDRLAQPSHHGAERALYAALAFVQNLAGQHQRPGRGIDEDRARATRMRRPVMRGNLVANQIVHRSGVGNTQQRLCETHQRHAFLGGQPVGGQEHLHQARVGRGTNGANEIGGPFRDRLAIPCGEFRHLGQLFQGLSLVGQIVGTDLLANGVKHLGFHGFP